MTSIGLSTTSIPLSRYITEKPQEIANSYSRKATMHCIAQTISAFAAVAILGGVAAVFFGLIAETALSGWTIVCAFAGFCLATVGIFAFSSWKTEANTNAKTYQDYAKTLKEIQDWTEARIKQFFRSEHIHTNRFSEEQYALLKAKNPEAPLKALLPLIARYLVANYQAEENKKIAHQLAGTMPDIERPQKHRAHKAIHSDNFFLAIRRNQEAAFYLQCLMELSLAAPRDSDLFETIKQHSTPQFSIFNSLYNRYYYGSTNPTVNEKISLRYPPREVRRLLFG